MGSCWLEAYKRMIRRKYWETCLTGVVTDDNVPSRWVPGGVLAIQKVIETGLLRFLHGFACRNFRIKLSSIDYEGISILLFPGALQRE